MHVLHRVVGASKKGVSWNSGPGSPKGLLPWGSHGSALLHLPEKVTWQAILEAKNPLQSRSCHQAETRFRTNPQESVELIVKSDKDYLNETASRWENTSYSATLRRPHQSLAQTAPLARATNLRIKSNAVPLPTPSFKCLYLKGRNALRRSHRLCRPFGYRLLPFHHPSPSPPWSSASARAFWDEITTPDCPVAPGLRCRW